MVKRTISFKLDANDIDRAIKELENFKREFLTKCDRLIQALTDYGVEVAKLEVRELDAVYTGELMNSIEGYFNPASKVGIIKAGAYYAIFVEFGTGVVGKSASHPNPQGWQYDVNNHGDSGWVYYDEDGGGYKWTKGFKSRPFMYNTARQLEKECRRISEGVFGK